MTVLQDGKSNYCKNSLGRFEKQHTHLYLLSIQEYEFLLHVSPRQTTLHIALLSSTLRHKTVKVIIFEVRHDLVEMHQKADSFSSRREGL